MFPGLDLCCADPAQPVTTAVEELDDLYDLDHDLCDLSVRGVNYAPVHAAADTVHLCGVYCLQSSE